MKRLPLICSLLAVIALSSSVAYWFLQLYKVESRPIVAAPMAVMAEPSADAAATLFGGQAVAAVASNYQLTGVVAAGRQGVAILVADGQPPKAVKVGREIAPGVTLSEVFPRYVMLSEGGVLKRIELATDAKAGPELAPPIGQSGAMQGQQVRGMPPQQPPQMQQPMPPPQQPNEQPQETPQQGGLPPGVPAPPPPQPEMPAPTRTVVSPGNQPPTQ